MYLEKFFHRQFSWKFTKLIKNVFSSSFIELKTVNFQKKNPKIV